MKIQKSVMLIAGLVLFVAGLLLMDQSIAGFILLIVGIALLILGSIFLMAAGGRINSQYFQARQYDPSNQAAQKVELQPDGENVWDKIEKK